VTSVLLKRRALGGVAVVAALGISLTACASNSDSASSDSSSSVSVAGGGSIPPGEPDVNGDGKVVIGVLSPGDINDHGYYESFVDSAEAFTRTKGWTVIKRGGVAPADARNAARTMCQQGVDMVALGASELSDAIPASKEAVCTKTAWYVPSSYNINQTPKIFLSSDDPAQDMIAAGYAAGLLMKAKGDKRAGFVAGPKADYSSAAAQGFRAGVREVIPSASVIVSYTGDNNDPAKGLEAAQAQIAQNISVLYPYLGGSADAVTKLANQHGVETLTPGTDRCDSTKPRYAISVLFSPGSYFESALVQFSNGLLGMGVSKVWQIGIDPFPTVKICAPTSEQATLLNDFQKKLGSGTLDATKEVKRLGG
jgi:basic membrane protein A